MAESNQNSNVGGMKPKDAEHLVAEQEDGRWQKPIFWVSIAVCLLAIAIIVVCWLHYKWMPWWVACIIFPILAVAVLIWWLSIGWPQKRSPSDGKAPGSDLWAPPPRWFSVLFLVVLILAFVLVERRQWWFAAQAILLGTLAFLGWWVWASLRSGVSGAQLTPAGEGGRSDFFSNESFVKLLQFVAVGVIGIIIYAIQYNHWNSALVAQTAGGGILTAGASLIGGALIGFLFGVPKTGGEGAAKASAATGGAAKPGDEQSAAAVGGSPSDYAAIPNTNLEQISDWLTKTIVGVSLVELHKVLPIIWKIASRIADAIDTAHPNPGLIVVIMVYFSGAGFLIAYLWTRLELTWAFGAWARREMAKQSKSDAFALATVDRWLNQPSAPNDAKALTQLRDAIRLCSSSARVRIFLEAERRREDGNKVDPEANDNAREVFKGLVDIDTEEVFHRNRSQYAYCLMGQPKPDWAGALAVLNDAIRIRDRSKDPGWREYEFARAACRAEMAQSGGNKVDSLTDANAKAAVIADLNAVKAAATKVTPERRNVIYAGGYRSDFDAMTT